MMRVIVAAAVVLGVYIMSGGRGDSVARGVRNNNPANIEKNGEQWQGLSNAQTDERFYQFVAPEFGIRAAARIIRTYATKYGIDTIGGIIARWAPVSENNTGAYIEHVAGVLGVSPTEPVNVFDNDFLADLVSVIIVHENGYNPYDTALIYSGVAMA